MQFDNLALVISPEGRAFSAVPDAPELSQSGIELLRDVWVVNETGSRESIQVPWERPLTLVWDDRELVTLMTLGASPEWLTLGYLRNQRMLDRVSEIESVKVDWRAGTASVKSRAGIVPSARTPDGPAGSRIGSGCGMGSGFPELLNHSLPAIGVKSAALGSRHDVMHILESMRQNDAIHRAAGSVHSCALFRAADLLLAVEDVSRHNGIDTVTGWMAYHGVAGADKILFTTGRLTGEMVLKAAHNGIPMMISRNGTTALGVELAEECGMTLLGRAAKGRFLCFTGEPRFQRGE